MENFIAAGSILIWTDPSGTIWTVDNVSWAGLMTLYARSALLVSATRSSPVALRGLLPLHSNQTTYSPRSSLKSDSQ